MICSHSGCSKRVSSKGLCKGHYERLRKYGRTHRVRRSSPNVCSKKKCPGAVILKRHVEYMKTASTVKARIAAWRLSHPTETRDKARDYRSRARHLIRSQSAARRAARISATPPWLSRDHRMKIKAVYLSALKVSEETGIPHEVDHIVPLRGRTVCGLHVPWNLRVIPAEINRRRPRIWDGDSGLCVTG